MLVLVSTGDIVKFQIILRKPQQKVLNRFLIVKATI